MSHVVIQTPLYRSSLYLPMLLKSLKAQTHEDWKFYACENSGDVHERTKVRELLEASGIPFHLEDSPHNLGFAGGHNALWQRHGAEYVLLLNEDAYLDRHHLERCLAMCAQHPMAAAVGGPVFFWSTDVDKEQPVNEETRLDTSGLEYRCLANVVDRDAGRRWFDIRQFFCEPQKIFGISGAVVMYRRSAVLQASPDGLLFDANFWMYREDVDLALRLSRQSWESWLDPQIISYHRRSLQFRSWRERLIDEKRRPAALRIASYRNLWRVMIYHASWQLGLEDWCKSIIHILLLSLVTIYGSLKVWWQASCEMLYDWPRAWQRRKDLLRGNMPLRRFLP